MTYIADPELRDQVAIVMGQYPNLSLAGFYFEQARGWNGDMNRMTRERAAMLGDNFVHQVDTCLARFCVPRGHAEGLYIARRSSYLLKHIIERWVSTQRDPRLSRYIAHAAFITAAVINGWRAVPDDWCLGPNCTFRRMPRRGGAKW